MSLRQNCRTNLLTSVVFVPADLGFAPLSAGTLPVSLLFGIALSNLRATEVIGFLEHQAADQEDVIMPQWLEQPAVALNPPDEHDAASRVRHITNSMDDEPRLFSMECPPLRPTNAVVRQRAERQVATHSVSQRARMTELVPRVRRGHDCQERTTFSLAYPYNDRDVDAVSNGASTFNFVNKAWTLRRGMAWNTANAQRLFLGETTHAYGSIRHEIVGSLELTVYREGGAPVTLDFLVFEPHGRATCEKMIVGLRKTPLPKRTIRSESPEEETATPDAVVPRISALLQLELPSTGTPVSPRQPFHASQGGWSAP